MQPNRASFQRRRHESLALLLEHCAHLDEGVRQAPRHGACAVFGISCTIPPNQRKKETETQVCKTCGLWFHVACKAAIVRSQCESENECGCKQQQVTISFRICLYFLLNLIQQNQKSLEADVQAIMQHSPPQRMSVRRSTRKDILHSKVC